MSSSMDPIWNILHQQGWGKYPNESLVRFVCRYKRAAGDDFNAKNKVLDVGCGGGANLKMIVDEGFDATGVDGSAEAIQNATAFVGPNRARYAVGDFLDLENIFKDRAFNIICDNVSICSNTLSVIETILSQINTLLAPEGWFYSSCFSTDTLGYGDGEELEPDTFTNIKSGALQKVGTVHFFNEASVRATYEKFFAIQSIDASYYTEGNGGMRIAHFIIIGRKK